MTGAADPRASRPGSWPYDHAILFTGHMIDAPGRKAVRFPARAEAAARAAIARSLITLVALQS